MRARAKERFSSATRNRAIAVASRNSFVTVRWTPAGPATTTATGRPQKRRSARGPKTNPMRTAPPLAARVRGRVPKRCAMAASRSEPNQFNWDRATRGATRRAAELFLDDHDRATVRGRRKFVPVPRLGGLRAREIGRRSYLHGSLAGLVAVMVVHAIAGGLVALEPHTWNDKREVVLAAAIVAEPDRALDNRDLDAAIAGRKDDACRRDVLL